MITKILFTSIYSTNEQIISAGSTDWYVYMWSFQTKQLLRAIKGSDEILGIAIRMNPNIILMHSYDSYLLILNLFQQGPPLLKQKVHLNLGFGLFMTQNSPFIVTSGKNDKIKLWNMKFICSRQLKLIRAFKYNCQYILNQYAWNFSVSENSATLVACGFRDKILIFDLVLGKLTQELKVPNGYQQYIAYVDLSKDQKYIATGGYDKTAKVFKAQMDQKLNNYSYLFVFLDAQLYYSILIILILLVVRLKLTIHYFVKFSSGIYIFINSNLFLFLQYLQEKRIFVSIPIQEIYSM